MIDDTTYQFARMQLASRAGLKAHSKREAKSCAADLLSEMKRDPLACPHVRVPKPPKIVFDAGEGWYPEADVGDLIDQLATRHETNAAAARVTLKSGGTRKMRKDTASMRCDVYSWPMSCEEMGQDEVLWDLFGAWVKQVTDLVRTQVAELGGRVEIAVVHVDETHPHVHVVSLHPSGRADVLHYGRIAKASVLRSGGTERQANQAYIEAMTQWLDALHVVNAKFGHERKGRGKQRLSFAAAVAEKESLKAQREAIETRDRLIKEIGELKRTRDFALSEKETAEDLRDAAKSSARQIEIKGEDRLQAAERNLKESRLTFAYAERRNDRANELLLRLESVWNELPSCLRLDLDQIHVDSDVQNRLPEAVSTALVHLAEGKIKYEPIAKILLH